jgi:hypothetical protein
MQFCLIFIMPSFLFSEKHIMPEDVQKKRERDRRYREKKLRENREEYYEKKRETYNKSYSKKMEHMSERDKRKRNREKKEYMRQWRASKKAPAMHGQSLELQGMQKSSGFTELSEKRMILLSPKSLAATKRESKRKSQEIRSLRKELQKRRREVWRMRYHQSREKKNRKCSLQNIEPVSPHEKVRKTMVSENSTRKALLAHFVLMETLSTSMQWTRWQKRLIALRVKQICQKYRGLKSYFIRHTKIHKNTLNKSGPSRLLQNTRSWKIDMDTLKHFLERDDNSRLTSGKKEVVSRRGTKVQIRYFNVTREILYEKFVSENLNEPIGKSTFYKYLSKFRHLKSPSLNARETCLCKICTNTQLLTDALYSRRFIPTREKESLVNKIVCSSNNFSCTHRLCEACQNKVVVDAVDSTGVIVTFYQWEESSSGSSVVCQKKEGSAASVLEKFEAQLSSYAGHAFRACHQLREVQHMRKNLQNGDIMLHVDYSENFTCKWNEEIQAAHFGNAHGQVVIHQGVMYSEGQEPQSFATISDDPRKTSDAVAAHIEAILGEAEMLFDIKRLIIVSDSPSSQYRNRYTLFLINKMCQEHKIDQLEWLFSESGHGKGAPDGVGAALKRMADSYVAHSNSVLNATDFISVCSTSKVILKLVTSAEIDTFKTLLNTHIPPMKGIAAAHHVVSANGVFFYQNLACHCQRENMCKCFNPIIWSPELQHTSVRQSNAIFQKPVTPLTNDLNDVVPTKPTRVSSFPTTSSIPSFSTCDQSKQGKRLTRKSSLQKHSTSSPKHVAVELIDTDAPSDSSFYMTLSVPSVSDSTVISKSNPSPSSTSECISSKSPARRLSIGIRKNKMKASKYGDNSYFCIYCAEDYKNSRGREMWVQCSSCFQWAHSLCAGYEGGSFTCDICR